MNKEKDAVSWLMRLKQILHLEPKTKEALLILLREARNRSIIDSSTFAMIESVIHFDRMQVRDIMLPKNQMVCINETDSLEKIIQTVTQSGHSRFPVARENSSDIIGILHAKDLLKYQDNDNKAFDLHDVIRMPLTIPESKRLDLMLGEFRNNRNHMALVVDEYGNLSGFVTIEDIIEQIIGDIEDEFDIDEEAYIKHHGRHHFIIKAHMPIEDFNEAFGTQFSDEQYDTIGGIVMAAFGHLPKRGETMMINHLEFKILHADSRRIKLLDCHDKRTLNNNPSTTTTHP